MADKEYTWTDKDKVVDHTKEVKKLWDLVIPETEDYIKKFTTNGVKWVEHRTGFGGKFNAILFYSFYNLYRTYLYPECASSIFDIL